MRCTLVESPPGRTCNAPAESRWIGEWVSKVRCTLDESPLVERATHLPRGGGLAGVSKVRCTLGSRCLMVK